MFELNVSQGIRTAENQEGPFNWKEWHVPRHRGGKAPKGGGGGVQ